MEMRLQNLEPGTEVKAETELTTGDLLAVDEEEEE